MMSSGFSTEFPNVADPMHDSYLSCFPKLNDDKFLHQDLNFLPCSSSMAVSKGPEIHQMKEFCEPVLAKKKRRATSEHIAGIALSDLAKYFDVPITEASRSLNVGLTVLKRKCREFGIHRWPHRKIKSIDGLIRDLQEEAKHREEDQKALMAVTKRQMMLQNERESIERTPFRELESETKRFRQDVFKRRHKARALVSHSPV
ncbi:protein RKD5-like isoform X1 [Cucurbita pepo subsp. pepo]|uniref:protein RKD5-like isoform X1 n=1 Tax=Cucurbita pepo subsp. pepo TaxID=3664 RepID=UPI000C9D7D13|nr:protein RKD5-like isoform X1 [Cucurbita pepo subsp. pepo]